jgi:hypothetical protein
MRKIMETKKIIQAINILIMTKHAIDQEIQYLNDIIANEINVDQKAKIQIMIYLSNFMSKIAFVKESFLYEDQK